MSYTNFNKTIIFYKNFPSLSSPKENASYATVCGAVRYNLTFLFLNFRLKIFYHKSYFCDYRNDS